MFDVGFSEMLVIAVVALIVIGPERLPKVARTLGHLWGRAQRYVNGVKADISRDMALEELRQLKEKVQQEADAATAVAREVSRQVEQQIDTSITTAEAPQQTSKPALPEQQKFPVD
jgi:sec-independent protein translocase protein TatB